MLETLRGSLFVLWAVTLPACHTVERTFDEEAPDARGPKPSEPVEAGAKKPDEETGGSGAEGVAGAPAAGGQPAQGGASVVVPTVVPTTIDVAPTQSVEGTGGQTGGRPPMAEGGEAGIDAGPPVATGGTSGAAAMGGTEANPDAGSMAGSAGAGNTCSADIAEACPDACAELPGPTLIPIAPGSLDIGSDDLPNTQPPRLFSFEAFCIDRTEVTVAQYRECFEAGVCASPDVETWSDCNWALPGRDDHPITCVSAELSATYCDWAGKRLPSEREWEYAARGEEGRLYPWGDDDPKDALLNWNFSIGETTPVASYPLGATPEGLFDFAGNVWEWTGSIWCESHDPAAPCTPGVYVARGGSYVSASADFVRPSWRDPDSAGDARFGFRCASGTGEGLSP